MGCTSQSKDAVTPFLEGAIEALVQLIQIGQHFFPQVTPNQEYEGLKEVFAVTSTEFEFKAAVDALNAAGIACHNPTSPKLPKSITQRKSKRIGLEVPDILEVEKQRESKRRRVDVIAAPRRQLWSMPLRCANYCFPSVVSARPHPFIATSAAVKAQASCERPGTTDNACCYSLPPVLALPGSHWRSHLLNCL